MKILTIQCLIPFALAVLVQITPSLAFDWNANGPVAGSNLGFSVDYAGDVNGDGFADAVIGAEGDATSGGAYVYLGKSDGLEAIPDWETTPTLNADARYGYSVSNAGDINGDGFGDVLVGAPFYSNDEQREGAAFLYLGGPNGLSSDSDWTFEPNSPSEYVGIGVAGIGDVNGDGFDDIAVGGDQAGDNAEGAVYVFYGSQDGLAANPDLTLTGSLPNGYFGNTVSEAGDVNGDGFADLAVGAYNSTNGESSEGMAFLFFGSAAGLSATPDWDYESDQSSAWFGSTLAGLGDVNGDGFSDLAVGASRYSQDTLTVGAAFVFHGSASGLSEQPVWSKFGQQVESGFGVVGGMGDYNADGFADLLIGSPDHTVQENAVGRVSLYLGSSNGIRSATSVDWWGLEDGARFGAATAAAGDVNADGISDLLVGAHLESGSSTEEGGAYLFLGEIHGYKPSTTWDDTGGQGQSLFGYDLQEVGDLNGDGYTDLAVGAPYDSGVGVNSGRVEIYYGGSDGLSIARSLTLFGEKAESLFGFSVAKAGDINGDGYADLAIGAPEYLQGESNLGAVYVYYGTSGQTFDGDFDRLLGEQANALFGYAVASNGDINGDGFSDLAISSRNYSDEMSEQGKITVYLGGEEGLNLAPVWGETGNTEFAHLGSSLEISGDYNRDGYSDLAVGAHTHSPLFTDRAAVLVFHGHHSGLPDSPDWIAGAGPGTFGTDIELASVGDVTTDGFSDLLVGAPSYSNGQQNEGAVHLFYGGIGGLDDSNTVESDQLNARLGASVTALGDIDGNGSLDVAAGMPQAVEGGLPKGKVMMWSGEPIGLAPFEFSPLSGAEPNGRFGFALSGGGDYNADGVPDLTVGAPYYDGGVSDQGRTVVYFGNDSLGVPLLLTQKDLMNDSLISPGGVSDSEGFRVSGMGTHAYGRGEIKFEVEYAVYPQVFSSIPNGSQLISGTDFTEVTGGKVGLEVSLSNLNEFVAYHWRARYGYPLDNPMGIQQSRWVSPTSLGPNGLHLRTRDETPPNNPAEVVETNGVPNGVWQNVTEDLHFTWSGATDPFGSGVLNYDVYWGDNPNGATPTATVTEPEYDPAPITVSFEHYLRIRTRDRQENVSEWQTFFITRYDGIAPSAPTEISEASDAQNGEWQNSVAAPVFFWSGEADTGGSGIAGYEVVWSTSATAEIATHTVTSASFDPPTVGSPSSHYFRVRVFDAAGNSSEWTDAFAFMLDNSAPVNPSHAVETGGTHNDEWQNSVSQPTFIWSGATDGFGSGIKEYDVYFGEDAQGQTPVQTTSDTQFSMMVDPSSAVRFLRVRTRDNLGNTSLWKTLFRFRFDPTPPSVPANCIETGSSETGVWTSQVDKPNFDWEDSVDVNGSGLQGYDVYWGTDMMGTDIIETVVTSSYSPPSVTGTVIYYLRARSKDRAGNVSLWADLFTFQFDGDAPVLPTEATEQGGAVSDTWRNDIPSPSFSWIAAEDGAGSGPDTYDVYFGEVMNGTTVLQNSPQRLYTPDAQESPSVDYLRVRAYDRAGNASPWSTLFISKYDITEPTNPAEVLSQPPIDSDQWQSDVSDPLFVWDPAEDEGSGVMNYDLSWSDQSQMFAATATVATEMFDPGPVDHLEVRYLGIRTRDNAGNVSDWEEKFVFRYDKTIPRNPSSATEENGALSGVWQNSVSDPAFGWQDAEGGDGAAITQYDIYWGTDQQGTTVTATVTEDRYDAPQLFEDSATYFLRIRTYNDAGKISNWSTIFVFRYDGLAPEGISEVVESQGVQSEVWQKTVSSPVFEWTKPEDQGDSGIDSYEISWLSSATATVAVNSTTEPLFAPGMVGAASPVLHLRIRSKDVAGNFSDWSLPLFTFQYDIQAPTNPTQVQEISGVLDGVWQNSEGSPTFTWSDGDDGMGSGVKDYRVFWGVDPVGQTAVTTTSTPSYSVSGPVQDGTWYLRISTRDQLDNAQMWETLFTFHYDTQAPNNPTAAQEAGGARNGLVQSAVSDPMFIWPIPLDVGGAGIGFYSIYWGESADGEVATATSASPEYDPGPLSGAQDLYLRVQTADNAGNTAPEWVTLFEFKYDPTIPSLPHTVQETNGAEDQKWQTTVSAPTFMWSGATAGEGAEITEYDLSWGTDPESTHVVAKTSDESYSFDPPPGDNSGGYTSFLRMKVRDSLGAESPWGTIFTFEYDPAEPSSTITNQPGDTLVSSTINIDWEGSDPAGGSGLSGVQVWYNKDDTGWVQYGETFPQSPALLDTSSTGGDGVYQFYILAVDGAGNIETDQEPTYSTEVKSGDIAIYLMKVSPIWYSQASDEGFDKSLDLEPDDLIDQSDVLSRIRDQREK